MDGPNLRLPKCRAAPRIAMAVGSIEGKELLKLLEVAVVNRRASTCAKPSLSQWLKVSVANVILVYSSG